ncbi:MAG: DNA topoisomerase IV subunit A [Sphaerochaetaceae bacterium]|nr:DNA topoisomerase IV subunit A [Sphaerochaetaceae bacterium]
MANAKEIYRQSFIEYASYVIKDRAIPDIEDGLKPVQRRILHTLIEMDDGRFHKVANVVGSTMHYHPHGDSSIYTALVNLANCDLFIDKQGNYGNFMTGDSAAAARYIECRLLPFAKKVLYNPEITEYVESYDGRGKEPVVFPAKIPVVLIQGTEGIAVGMSTKILPHNALEVIDAQIAAIKGEDFKLYPDFPGGGIMDVSDYQDGLGSVAVRAKLDVSNPKKIVIEELPFGVDSESMIRSIDEAAKKGKLKVSQINDFTADKVNIEIYLSKGTYTADLVDALYAYTLCEQKISVNCLVIKDKMPHVTTVSDIIRYHADHLIKVSKAELEVERGHLYDRLHTRTLERIFIEERIYKRIEQKRTQEAVVEAVITGFAPYKDELVREISGEDVEHLLKIPIRRISLFDIQKNLDEIDQINADIKKCEYNLSHLKQYAVKTLTEIRKDLDVPEHVRKTKIAGFDTITVKEVAKRDLDLRYDESTGYLGTAVKTGTSVEKVSEFDRILVINKKGTYYCNPVSEKTFVGKDIVYIGLADKDILENIIFTAIYQEKSTKKTFIKRAVFNSGFIMNKPYEFLPNPEDNILRKLSTLPEAEVTITFKGAVRNKEGVVYFSDFRVRGAKAGGVLLSRREVASMRIKGIKARPEEKKPATDTEDDEDSGNGFGAGDSGARSDLGSGSGLGAGAVSPVEARSSELLEKEAEKIAQQEREETEKISESKSSELRKRTGKHAGAEKEEEEPGLFDL